MGLRERLEVIRENNRDGEGRLDLEFNRPEIGALDRVDPLRGRPWLSIWLRPRDTIRRVVLFESEWSVLGLGAATGTARALSRAATRDFGDRLPLEVIVAASLILGPTLQFVTIYLGGWILRFCGALFGGKASFAEVRAALAWGAFPQAAMLLLWGLALILFQQQMFLSTKPILSTYPSTWLFFFLFHAFDLILIIWSLILTLNTLAAVFRMRVIFVVLACLVSGCVIVGAAVLGSVLWSDPTFSSFRLGRFS
ncbi:Yip1 domain-containing protein [Singulisphaera sp. GP187]|uniref:YIP1 family protein n=1 Tax=Singulisphaera sp. GP187 TaxID=1882752 RepID=UPI00092CAAAD|nr:YIP1 family protein [Singulisphaera sp. GP187]SIO25625.1 Yip1 domain-containing protein [Singulisphaera sp. GP187]